MYVSVEQREVERYTNRDKQEEGEREKERPDISLYFHDLIIILF